MATFLINHDIKHIAKLTDIVEYKISEVGAIAALVYTRYDGGWRIIDSNSTLKSYVQPILESE